MKDKVITRKNKKYARTTEDEATVKKLKIVSLAVKAQHLNEQKDLAVDHKFKKLLLYNLNNAPLATHFPNATS